MTEMNWKDPNAVLRQVRGMLEERGQRIAAVPVNAVRRATFELQAIVKKLVPKKTSTLARSVTAQVAKESGAVVGRVGTHLKYARYIEEGTGIYGPKGKPILITARRAGGLFWGAYDKNGKPIIRRQVNIQGMKPRAPFGNATRQFLPRYVEIVQQELAKEAAA